MKMEAVAPTPIFVQWIDSTEHYLNWVAQSEYLDSATADVMEHQTVGWLVGESPHSILITNTFRPAREGETDATVGTCLQIPRAAVVDMREISLPEKNGKKQAA